MVYLHPMFLLSRTKDLLVHHFSQLGDPFDSELFFYKTHMVGLSHRSLQAAFPLVQLPCHLLSQTSKSSILDFGQASTPTQESDRPDCDSCR